MLNVFSTTVSKSYCCVAHLAGLNAKAVTIHNRFPASMIVRCDVLPLLRRPLMMVLHHLLKHDDPIKRGRCWLGSLATALHFYTHSVDL